MELGRHGVGGEDGVVAVAHHQHGLRRQTEGEACAGVDRSQRWRRAEQQHLPAGFGAGQQAARHGWGAIGGCDGDRAGVPGDAAECAQRRQVASGEGAALGGKAPVGRGVGGHDLAAGVDHQRRLVERGGQARPDGVRRALQFGRQAGDGVRAEDEGVHAGADAGGGDIAQVALAAAGQADPQAAAHLALDEEGAAGLEKGAFVREQRGQRLAGEVAIAALHQPADGAVNLQDGLVAGNDQPLVHQFEQGQVQAGFGPFGQIGDKEIIRVSGHGSQFHRQPG